MTVNKFPDDLGINLAQGAPSGALVYPDKFNSDMMTSYFAQMFGDGISNSLGVRDHVISGVEDWTTNRVQQFRNLTIESVARVRGDGPYICIGVQEKLIIRGADPQIQLLGSDAAVRIGGIGRGGDGRNGPTNAAPGLGGYVSTSGISNIFASDGGDGGVFGGGGGSVSIPFSLAGGGGGGGGGDNGQPGGGGGGGGQGGLGGPGGTVSGLSGSNTSVPLEHFYLDSDGVIQANGVPLPTPPVTRGGALGWGGGGGSGAGGGGNDDGGGSGAGGGGVYIEANEIEIDPALIGSDRLIVDGGEGKSATTDGGSGGGGGGGSIFVVCNKCNLTSLQLINIMSADGGLGAPGGDGGTGGVGGEGTRACYIFQQ